MGALLVVVGVALVACAGGALLAVCGVRGETPAPRGKGAR